MEEDNDATEDMDFNIVVNKRKPFKNAKYDKETDEEPDE